VEASKTVYEIQCILQSNKAKALVIDYGIGGEVKALSFIIDTPQGEVPFRLPVNVDAVQKVMQRQRRVGRTDRAQAVRVAWRINKDWLLAQMALLETEQVRLEQIFLPYAVTSDGRTFFDVIVENRFLLGDGQKCSSTNAVCSIERSDTVESGLTVDGSISSPSEGTLRTR